MKEVFGKFNDNKVLDGKTKKKSKKKKKRKNSKSKSKKKDTLEFTRIIITLTTKPANKLVIAWFFYHWPNFSTWTS